MTSQPVKKVYIAIISILCMPLLQGWAQSTPPISEWFETIRTNEAMLQYFFSRMPKGGDLHNHLSGSVFAESYFDIALKEGFYLDTVSFKLYAKEDFSMPQSCKPLFQGMCKEHFYRMQCVDHWSIRNYDVYQSTPSNDFFFATFEKFDLATDNHLVEMIKELRLRAESENVQYLEIMAKSPKPYRALLANYQGENDRLISLIQAKDSIAFSNALLDLHQKWVGDVALQESIHAYINLIDSLERESASVAPSVTVYYQAYASRNVPNPLSVFAQLYMGFKSCAEGSFNAGNKLVGVNILQPEDGEYALRDYWGHIQMFHYLKRAVRDVFNQEVPTSVHAGELSFGLMPPEDLQHHISDAVLIAKANRIGHGVGIAFEKKAPELLQKMALHPIPVEVNLSSNEFILGVTGSDHPILLFHKHQVPIVLSTDDAGILRTTLSQQFVLAALRYPELKYSDFRQIAINSIEYSFLPMPKKLEIMKMFLGLLSDFESQIIFGFIPTTEKDHQPEKAKLSAEIALDGMVQTGNIDKTNVSGAINLSATDAIKEFSANGKISYGQNNKVTYQREYIAGIQCDYHPFAKISPFLRIEYYRNEFKKISGRYSGLSGVKYRYFVKEKILDYSISAALMYDLDHYISDINLKNKERFRLSIRPKFKHQLTESLYLVAEVFYKPNVVDFCDFIVHTKINLNFMVFKQGFLRMSYEHEYNTFPATDKVKKRDALLLVGVGFTL